MVTLLNFVRDRIHFDQRWFFLFYVLAGIPYLFLTGPFRSPDERNHFLRSYEISELRFHPFRPSGGFVGDELPSSLSRLSEALGDHSVNYIEPGQITLARSLRLDPEKREFAECPMVLYSPVAYLASAASIAIGRTFGAGPLALVYFARAGNLLVVAWLISLALSHAGFARPAALIVALFPMTLAQVASVSADAMTYGISFLWVALVMELAVGPRVELGRKRILLLLGLALVVSGLRPPYPLIGLLVFLIPLRRFGGKIAILICSAIAVASLLPAVVWNVSVADLYVKPAVEQNIDPQIQLQWVAKHPGSFWHRVKQDFYRNWFDYWEEIVGRLGWLNIRLPGWVIFSFAAVFLACICLGSRAPPSLLWWQRLALLLTVLVGAVAIAFLQFLSFNPIRSDYIVGMQGRYFIPFAFVGVFAVTNSLLRRESFVLLCKVACPLFVLSAHLCVFFTLARVAGKI